MHFEGMDRVGLRLCSMALPVLTSSVGRRSAAWHNEGKYVMCVFFLLCHCTFQLNFMQQQMQQLCASRSFVQAL